MWATYSETPKQDALDALNKSREGIKELKGASDDLDFNLRIMENMLNKKTLSTSREEGFSYLEDNNEHISLHLDNITAGINDLRVALGQLPHVVHNNEGGNGEGSDSLIEVPREHFSLPSENIIPEVVKTRTAKNQAYDAAREARMKEAESSNAPISKAKSADPDDFDMGEPLSTFTKPEIKSPLDQFEIRDLISFKINLLDGLQFSLSNLGLYLVIGTFIFTNLNILATNRCTLISSYWSITWESIYNTIFNIVKNQINSRKGQVFFPFIYSLFVFILVNNIISMIPYCFASTSHFILTFSISFSIIIGSTLLGFNVHFLEFFSLFVPSGCPLLLLPVLVLIEFISYLTRNISLGLRLAANIFSGHMLLNILSEFTYKIINSGLFFSFLAFLPLIFVIVFSSLEMGISFIQSQVFSVLSAAYIRDSLSIH